MAEEGALYKVSILLDGYGYTDEEKRYRANGTSTLITGPNNRIIVDTGSPKDKQRLLDKLKHLGHAPEEVNFVVCTHGHIDHVGNLNLFPNAVQMVSHDILQEQDYYADLPENFDKGTPYCIDGETVQVISTPGHTFSDVSVVVRSTDYGTVIVCGDLFEHEDDENVWEEYSECPEKHKESRAKVLGMADWVIPGHGKMFKVNQPKR